MHLEWLKKLDRKYSAFSLQRLGIKAKSKEKRVNGLFSVNCCALFLIANVTRVYSKMLWNCLRWDYTDMFTINSSHSYKGVYGCMREQTI